MLCLVGIVWRSYRINSQISFKLNRVCSLNFSNFPNSFKTSCLIKWGRIFIWFKLTTRLVANCSLWPNVIAGSVMGRRKRYQIVRYLNWTIANSNHFNSITSQILYELHSCLYACNNSKQLVSAQIYARINALLA